VHDGHIVGKEALRAIAKPAAKGRTTPEAD
jgi:hypothetical protein